MKAEGNNNGSFKRAPRGSRIHWIRPDNTNGKAACGISISPLQPPLDRPVTCAVCQSSLNVRLRRSETNKSGHCRIEDKHPELLNRLGKSHDSDLAVEYACHAATLGNCRRRHGIPPMRQGRAPRPGGQPKEGRQSLTLHLTPEELSSLRELAEENCRSASGQAVWLIRTATRETQ